MARRLEGKVIAITGGSSGIGAATAIECAKAGMAVTIGARRVEKLELVAEAIRKLGGRAEPIACDVDRDEDVARFIERVWETFGRLDAVFANAGYGLSLRVLDTSDEQMRAIFETNFYGTLRTLRAAIPRLRQTPDGLRHVLICSSVVSEIGPPLHGAYAATKAAQDVIGQALRAELADEGMAVTTIHPSKTRTDFFKVKAGLSDAPDGGPAEPPDVADQTPGLLTQSAEHVARKVVAALRRPRAEVWPLPAVRWGVALATAMPGLASTALRRLPRGNGKSAAGE